MAEKKYRVFFRYNARYETKSVDVIGDFNQWKPGITPLADTDGDNIWDGFTDLSPGEYQYKFLIDGNEYRTDTGSKTVFTAEGYENSVLTVGKANNQYDAMHSPADIDSFRENTIYLKASFNKQKYCNPKLILFINDSPSAVNGYPLYWDENYYYYIFKFQNGLLIENCLYYFEMEKKNGEFEYFGSNGVVASEWEVCSFEIKKLLNNPFKSPDWVKNAVFYQIFPERFNNSRKNNESQALGSDPEAPDKGDLEGIIQKTDYFLELGINAIYLNPIFEASSSHKYNTSDYEKIDHHLGTNDSFDKMAQKFRKNSIRFILDGVFNHTGTDFFAFKDVEINENKSRYINWYKIKKFPLLENGKPNYECWWDFKDLPKLNMDNPEVIKYILKCAALWIKKGASGWRLDVPNEIPHSFWKEFRNTVKSINPDAYIMGEIWQNGSAWLNGDEFDAVMNYRFRDASVNFFAYRRCSAEEFIKFIGTQINDYPMQANFAMLNLLSSHDTARFFTVINKDTIKLKLALAFQFTFLGTPSIYYGEEIGMEGGKDPDNRRFMIWNKKQWNYEVSEIYRLLIKIRNENEILRNGDFRFIYGQNMVIGYERFNKENKLVIFINNSDKSLQIDVTKLLGNGDFIDISKDHPLKRKRAYRLYPNDFVILKKIKNR